ncbi:hypothetical protein [Streptomyces malaysiense]|uniref:DUF559 domain-containing protein n=1 Tax=Streptomyces malaysiense TaxID=1428626 RepID=A0A1J4PRA4_9ACTN|nr:hypothetical protein [Streptomyces malaysiense]OIK23459.1 hypothetical protein VT52_032425 [Streptomyces malaysiense]
MTHNAPLSSRTLGHLGSLAEPHQRVRTTAQLRAHGVTAAELSARCRPGGPWSRLLPHVYLLRPGPPTGEERLHGALRYAARRPAPGVPVQPTGRHAHRTPYPGAVLTGLTALAVYGFAQTRPENLEHVDVLVPRQRRLRSTGYVRVLRTADLPAPATVGGLPVAPVPRALADAVAQLRDGKTVRRLLTEAVRGGHCEPAAVVAELSRAKLLGLPHVVDAVDSLVAAGRAIAESRLYRMVREHGLPDPLWNVELRLPGGPRLGALDAYWPDQAVAVELDTRGHRRDGADASDEETEWSRYARKREHLERLGITVVHLSPRKLGDAMEQQAAVVRTALMAANDREPAAYVVVLPR